MASPGGSPPELIDHVFGSAMLDVICSEYGLPIVPGVVDSGPIVSFGSPGTIVIETCSFHRTGGRSTWPPTRTVRSTPARSSPLRRSPERRAAICKVRRHR